MSFKKNLKSYSKNQWLLCWELKKFNKAYIFHAIMLKSEHSWWNDNNCTEKLVIERLSQTTYDFSNIRAGNHDKLLDIVLDLQI